MGSQLSSHVSVSNGVKDGGILSPILFTSVYGCFGNTFMGAMEMLMMLFFCLLLLWLWRKCFMFVVYLALNIVSFNVDKYQLIRYDRDQLLRNCSNSNSCKRICHTSYQLKMSTNIICGSSLFFKQIAV